MHAKPLRLLGLALLAGLCWLAVPTAAEERQNVYHVGVEGQDYLPHFSSEGGEFHGFARELLDAFAQDAGIRLVYVPLPIKRLLQEFLVRQSLDFKYPDHPIYGLPIKEQLRAGVHYSRPVVKYLGGTMVRPERLGQGMNGFRRLGTVLGFATFNFDDFVRAGIVQVVEESEIPALLRMAIAGRVDGVDLDVAVARYYLAHDLRMPGALVFDPELPHVRWPYHLSTLRHPELLQGFDAFLIREAPLVAKLKAKWGVEP